MMNKYVWAIFLFNESIALAVIKPFYYSLCHGDNLLEKILIVPSCGLPLWQIDLSFSTKPVPRSKRTINN